MWVKVKSYNKNTTWIKRHLSESQILQQKSLQWAEEQKDLIFLINIARGTTDPGIASITWIISPTSKQANSEERKIQQFIGSNFDHQVALTALVPNLPTRWRHLPWLQICISSKFGHQMVPPALVRLGKIEARVTSF